MKYVYKNNDAILESELSISYQDRSFRFGDGCFETIPFKNQKCLYLDHHIKRLKETLFHLKMTLNLDKIDELIKSLIKKNQINEGLIRIIVSRGSGSRGYLPDNSIPFFIITTDHMPHPLTKPQILYHSSYTLDTNKTLPTVGKLNSSLLSVLARIEAEENLCNEAILYDADASITECSSSNIFFRNNNTLYFPEKKNILVSGITEKILKSIYPHDIEEVTINNKHIQNMDYAYTCNSVSGIVPVKEIFPDNITFKIDDNDSVISHYNNHVENYFKD